MARAQAVLWFDLTTSPVKRLSCPRALRGSFVRKFAQILSQPVPCWHRGPFSSPTGTPVLCQKLWNNFPLPHQTSHVFPPQNSDSQHWNKPDSFWILEGIKQKATQRHWLPWYFMVQCLSRVACWRDFPKNENSFIIYSLSCLSRPVGLFVFCETDTIKANEAVLDPIDFHCIGTNLLENNFFYIPQKKKSWRVGTIPLRSKIFT